MSGGNGKKERLETVENIVNKLKIPSLEELAEEEEEIIAEAIGMTSGKTGIEAGPGDDPEEEKPDYIIRYLVECGAIPAEPEAQLEKLKSMHHGNHAGCSCRFCRHKEKLIEVIGNRFYLLPRLV